jgi:tricorn protease
MSLLKPIARLLCAGLLCCPLLSLAINTHDTRMLFQPAVSADHIAFVYAGDLWVANLDGSLPRRLTVSEGVESNPYFRRMGNGSLLLRSMTATSTST